ncbi:hypothetical protein UFOVP159_2 [uncultured Caudovirales phage]|uniref:Uncharacterized protein n=1 Tax=uncultured Caudovirales phage TaxID=2100421 RepID=A0A6J7WCY5_9CAUD|nr:hypothetical protein UFOVP159_2 [uncultured Caudovirales phage]
MTDKEVEDIIRSNMNLQMNLAGIRQDFEEKLQRTWVGLTEAQCGVLWKTNMTAFEYYQAIEAKLKEKNT